MKYQARHCLGWLTKDGAKKKLNIRVLIFFPEFNFGYIPMKKKKSSKVFPQMQTTKCAIQAFQPLTRKKMIELQKP